MDNLSILKERSQVLEGRLMSVCAHGYNDDACALNGLCHIAGNHIKVCLAAAVEAVTVGLRSDQVKTGLLEVLQGLCCEGHRVKESDFLAVAYAQLAVDSDGLSYSAAADDSDRFRLQILHAHSTSSYRITICVIIMVLICTCLSFMARVYTCCNHL